MPRILPSSKTFALLAIIALLSCLPGCDPMSIQESLKQAQADIDAGHPDIALQLLQKLHLQHPKDDSVTEALAFAELNNGSASKAGDLFNSLGLANNPDDLLCSAQAYQKAGENDKAIDAYRLYLLNEPAQAAAWDELGELLVVTHQDMDGIDALEKSCEISPSADLSFRIGTLYEANSNPVQAERYLQNALKLSAPQEPGQSPPPIEADILAKLADMALRDHHLLEAERHIRQIDRDFPTYPKLADLKDQLAKGKAAVEAAEKAAADKIAAEKAAAEKEVARQAALKEAAAKTQAEKSRPKPIKNAVVSTTFPAGSSVLVPLTIIPDPALEALERDSKNPEAWKALARDKAKSGDWAWAEAAYLEAMRLQPGNGPTILAYLDVVSHRKTSAEYLQEAQKMLTKYPNIPELYLVTARGYRDRQDNRRNAYFIFKQFLQKFPSSPQAPDVRAEMEALQ